MFTAVSLLFQMTVMEIYADCSVNGDTCPYNWAYIDEPGRRVASQVRATTHLIVSSDRYDSLQDYFNSEFNTFGARSHKCKKTSVKSIAYGQDITMHGMPHSKCEGNREKTHGNHQHT